MKKILIVGSGMGGGALALELSRKGFIVTIIEAGLEGQKGNIHQDIIEEGKKSGLERVREIGLGGTSNLWHGVMGLYDGSDFDDRTAMGWPINYSELIPYWSRAFEFLSECEQENSFLFGENISYPEGSESNIIKINKKILEEKKFNVLLSPTRLANNLSLSKNKIKIIYGQRVVKYILDEKNYRRIVSVKCWDGMEYRDLSCDILVLSAGSLESPCIALRSEQHSAGEIHNFHGNIGRWLLDHPMGFLGKVRFKESLYGGRLADLKINNKLKERFGLRIRERFKLNANLYLRPAIGSKINTRTDSEVLSLLSEKLNTITGAKIYKILKSPENLNRILRNKFSLKIKQKNWELFMVGDQTPTRNSFVSTVKTDDPKKMIATVNWKISDSDFEEYEKIIGYINSSQLFEQPYVITDFYAAKEWITNSTSAAHMMGTMRMGSHIETSVVDKNLKFHSIDNLYVADASAIPVAGNVNPSLTICALSIRLADHLERLMK